MLPKNAWKPHEPRFGFPTFRDFRTLCSFSIRPDFTPFNPRRLHRVAARAALLGTGAFVDFVKEYSTLALEPDFGRRLSFRVIITTRRGEYLATRALPGSYPPGGSIDVDATAMIAEMGLEDDDYLAILVMSRGRTDGFRSSPGSYSMTYIGDKVYTTYRTGGFARALNDPRRKGHSGFRGINPKVIVDDQYVSSILLINHSSNPIYDATVSPTSVLLRADGQTREAPFGSIPAFGALDRSVEDLFGADVSDFLRPFGGRGTVITTARGATLASLHLMRCRDGSSMSIEHSRPSHTYLLSGIAG